MNISAVFLIHMLALVAFIRATKDKTSIVCADDKPRATIDSQGRFHINDSPYPPTGTCECIEDGKLSCSEYPSGRQVPLDVDLTCGTGPTCPKIKGPKDRWTCFNGYPTGRLTSHGQFYATAVAAKKSGKCSCGSKPPNLFSCSIYPDGFAYNKKEAVKFTCAHNASCQSL